MYIRGENAVKTVSFGVAKGLGGGLSAVDVLIRVADRLNITNSSGNEAQIEAFGKILNHIPFQNDGMLEAGIAFFLIGFAGSKVMERIYKRENTRNQPTLQRKRLR